MSTYDSAAARPAFHKESGDLQTSTDVPQSTSVYSYAPFASHHKNNNLQPVHEQKISTKKPFDSRGVGVVGDSEAKGYRWKFILLIAEDWLLLEAIVTKTGRAEWKTDSLQSSPVVFCLRSAHAPIIPAPLNG